MTNRDRDRDRVRTTALSLAWTLVACHGGGSASIEPSSQASQADGPIAELQADDGLLPIILVPQLTAIELDMWSFEPGGNRLGSTEMGDCSVWDIPSGRLIRSFEGDTGPCESWPAAVGFGEFMLDDTSADKTLAVELTDKGVVILDTKTHTKLRDLHCPDCNTVDHVSWSQEGHQLALAWQDNKRLEIWDADAGTLVRAESIPIDGELEALQLGWTRAGATVSWTQLGFPVECDDDEANYGGDCEWDEVDEISVKQSIERRIFAVGPSGANPIDALDAADPDSEVSFDPEFRWVFWTESYTERRGGTTTTLNFESLGESHESHSGLGWELVDDDYGDYGGYGESTERDGEWHTDGATHWAVTIGHSEYSGNPSIVEWETTITSPALGRRTGLITDVLDLDSHVDVELFGFANGAIRFAGEVDAQDQITLGRPLPPNCMLLDVGSGHGTELLDCEGVAFLRNTGAPVKLPIDADTMQWSWSRKGSLGLLDGASFMVLEAATNARTPARTDVIGMLEGRLGPELERLVLVTANGLELIELTHGKTILKLPGAAPDDVAISPSADRLALLEAGELRVLALPGGEPIASWAVESSELAFRQDGKAIFVGIDQPELAFDAATGKPIKDRSLVRISAAIERGGVIDPSWRWIMNDEEGELTRALDGRVLAFRDGVTWLPDTGQYVGPAPGSELAFRVGSDAWAVPEFDAARLSKWLERGDLVELFLTGQTIEAPRMSAAELAVVRAKAQAPAPTPEPGA